MALELLNSFLVWQIILIKAEVFHKVSQINNHINLTTTILLDTCRGRMIFGMTELGLMSQELALPCLKNTSKFSFL